MVAAFICQRDAKARVFGYIFHQINTGKSTADDGSSPVVTRFHIKTCSNGFLKRSDRYASGRNGPPIESIVEARRHFIFGSGYSIPVVSMKASVV